jgi:chromosome partitioning protein
VLGVTPQHVYSIIKTQNIDHYVNKKNRRKLLSPAGVRKLFEHRGYKYPNLNISFQIVKGGVGKTSLSFSLGVRAYQYGARVLVIDLDAQGNLTRSFNVDAKGKPIWINIYKDNMKVQDTLVTISENLHLIPSNLNNSGLDVEIFRSMNNIADIIKNTIAPIRDNYDLVIMDCPPTINMMNTAATCASDLIIIPINPDSYSMDRLEYTLFELKRIKKNYKIDCDYRIFWNRYDGRLKTALAYMSQLHQKDELGDKISSVVCRTDSALDKAVANCKSIFEMSKRSNIREDIDQFTSEVLGISEWIEEKTKPK